MDLQVKAITYDIDGQIVRHVIGSNGVSDILDDNDTIRIITESSDLVLEKKLLGNWTLQMFANVEPE